MGREIILKCKHEHALPSEVCEVLTALDVIVLVDLPDFVLRNMGLVYHFVHPPTCEGLVDTLISQSLKLSEELLAEKVKNVWCNKYDILQDFLSYLSDAGVNLLSKKKKMFLRGISMFSTVGGFQPVKSVSVNEVYVSGPCVSLPVPFPIQAVSVSCPKVTYLLECLGVAKYHTFSFSQLLKDVLIPAIKSMKYTTEQVDDLVCYIMDNYHNLVLSDTDISAEIAEIGFTESDVGGRHVPHDLFDPTDSVLAGLLDKSLFPHQKYHTKDRLACLQTLGLKPAKDVTAKMFLDIADSLSTQPKKADQFIQLTKLLSKERPDNNWWKMLQGVAFLSPVPTEPDGYPASMPWVGGGSRTLLRPADVCHIKFSKQVGSVLPLVDLEESILAELGTKIAPTLEDLVSQLKLINLHYNQQEKSRYVLLLEEVYGGLAGFTRKEIKGMLTKFQVSSWIWCGTGFQTPGKMVLSQSEVDVMPYVFTLPTEMENHKDLMHRCGVQESVQLSRILKMIAARHEAGGESLCKEVEHDLQLVINILTILVKQGVVDPFVPVETYGTSRLRLLPASECTIRDGSTEVDNNLSFVHHSVPQEIANSLYIPTVMHRVLDGEEFSFYLESFGQTEPLTSRLKSVLEGYTDGLSVLKEMIQNADDAGATEVRLIYDMRENKDHRKSLLDPGMSTWQGPALWIYNDSVFRDEDFENITKLNGATKADEHDKIGTFGLGFNAVYNLTDVPSILSRDIFVVFDPHTTYLGSAVKDRSKPGLKINLGRKQGQVLNQYPDQFAPWNGICGCKLDSQSTEFDGTLFRLPLRGHRESCLSEISSLYYDQKNMIEFLQMIHDKGSNMLLFTQNVLKVSVSLIQRESTLQQGEIQDLFQITKEPIQYLREHGIQHDLSPPSLTKDVGTQKFICESSILKASVQGTVGKQVRSSIIIATVLETSQKYSEFVDTEGTEGSLAKKHSYWAISNCVQSMPEIKKPESRESAVAGIAICLEKEKDTYTIRELDSKSGDGQGWFYSFLPLPVKCPLPFHINGTFILDQSRRHLMEKTDHDKTSIGGTWNKELIEGVVCTAYMTTLEDILPLIDPTNDIMGILPHHMEEDLIDSLSEAFWKRIIGQVNAPEVFTTSLGRVALRNVCFLDESFLEMPDEIQNTVVEIVSSQLSRSKLKLVDLPYELRKSLGRVDMKMLKTKIITMERFFLKYFLPKQKTLGLTPKEQEYLLMRAILLNSDVVSEALKTYPCIPVSQDGQTLAFPEDLVHPQGRAATLFTESDNRFPYFSPARLEEFDLYRLCDLGMVKDDLEWEDVLERSSYIAACSPHTDLSIINAFLDYLNWKLAAGKGQIPEDVKEVLQKERFLPPVKRPAGWPLTWKGDESVAFSSSEIYKLKEPLLAGTQLPILHKDIRISAVVAQELGVKGQDFGYPLQIETLKDQVTEIVSNKKSLKSLAVQKSLTRLYKYLNSECKDEIKAEKIGRLFSNSCIVQAGHSLVFPETCAFELQFDGYPYLNQVTRKYERLMKAVGVKEEFTSADYIMALAKVKERYGSSPLPKEVLQLVQQMVYDLVFLLSQNHQTVKDQKYPVPLFLPDMRSVLLPACELCYIDSKCSLTKVNYPLMHSSVDRWAEVLGIEGLRARSLADRCYSIKQYGENLNTHINSVLEMYPFGTQVFTELIKDADAAGAKEIHFILDPRTHSNTSTFNENWKHVQGPALCMYDDAMFTRNDLEQYVHLLTATNVDNAKKLGYQGVGLQSIYHLTDTPTLLTSLQDGKRMFSAVDQTHRIISGTSQEEPGMIYQDLDVLRQLYPDVFTCYLEKQFTTGRFFRFPLRTSETAKMSPISQSSRTNEEVDSLFHDLQREGYEALLFLTSVRKIHISRVDIRSGIIETKVISATLEGATQTQVEDFREHVQQSKQLPGSCERLIPKKISYSLIMNGKKKTEKWLIVQQCGISRSRPHEQDPEFEGQEVPVGGVAHLQSVDGQDLCLPNSEKQIFGCLPVSQETCLPVHIYGCYNMGTNAHSTVIDMDFGKLMLNRYTTAVIVSCYLTLIKEKKLKVADESMVQNYFNVFPTKLTHVTDHDADINSILCGGKFVEDSIVQQLYLALTKEDVIPVTVSKECVKWAAPNEAIFVEHTMTHELTDVVTGAKLCGLYFAVCPEDVISAMKTYCQYDLHYFSPSLLIQFLKDPERCNTSQLAKKVESTASYINTRFSMSLGTGFDIVKAMLKFCLKEEKCEDELQSDETESVLSQLPLLVTADGKLGTFMNEKQVYSSPDIKLVKPESKDFLHPDFIEMFKEKTCPVFKELDLEVFCQELKRHLPDELCQNKAVLRKDVRIDVTQEWLDSVLHFFNKKNVTCADLTQHAGDLCLLPTTVGGIRFLHPMRNISTVFLTEMDSTKRMQKENISIYSLNTTLERHDVPVAMFLGEHLELKRLLASWKRPSSIVQALYHHHRNDTSLASVFQDDMFIRYLTVYHKQLSLYDQTKLKALPVFETLTGTYVTIAGCITHVIPPAVPMEDMDSWKKSYTDTLFLKAKDEFKPLYVAAGCIYWDETKLYIEYIFPQLELLSDHGRKVHMEYVFNHLDINENVLKALENIPCVKSNAGNYYCPCELYDSTVPLFLMMHDRNELVANDFAGQKTLEILRKAGLKHIATKEMLHGYAQSLSIAKRNVGQKSRYIVDYIASSVSADLHATYLKYLADVPFIPRKDCIHSEICPERTQDQYVTLSGSIPESHEQLVWSVAPLVADWYFDFDKKTLDAAGLVAEPSCVIVAHHIKRVCEYNSSTPITLLQNRQMLNTVIDSCYSYISRQIEQARGVPLLMKKSLQEVLSDSCCVPVEQATRFVKPSQTVLEAQPGEEVKPYIYRLPDNLAYNKSVLQLLGLSTVPTVRTYQTALKMIFQKHGQAPIKDATDLGAAKQATKQIFCKIKNDRSLNEEEELWVLSTENCLRKACDVIVSNNVALQNRLRSTSNILVDVKMVGNVSSVLSCFPETHRPKVLSAAVKEVIAHGKWTSSGKPTVLGECLLRSHDSFKRLAHHSLMQKNPESEAENQTSDIACSLQEIKVRVVEKLKTCLTNCEADVVGNWTEKIVIGDVATKIFYVEERALEPGSNQIYTYKVLADMINTISGGLFKEYKSELMVILAEKPENVPSRLDEMGISRYQE